MCDVFFRYSVLFSRNEFLKTCSPSLLFIDNDHASDWLYKGNMVYTRTPTRSLQYIHISTHTRRAVAWPYVKELIILCRWPFSGLSVDDRKRPATSALKPEWEWVYQRRWDAWGRYSKIYTGKFASLDRAWLFNDFMQNV